MEVAVGIQVQEGAAVLLPVRVVIAGSADFVTVSGTRYDYADWEQDGGTLLNLDANGNFHTTPAWTPSANSRPILRSIPPTRASAVGFSWSCPPSRAPRISTA